MTHVEFHAYAGDCLVDARIDLPDGTRLTDYLNESSEFPLTQVRMIALDDGRIVEVGDVLISMDELHAVEATDPGGRVERRIRTRASEVDIVVGPYRVHGYLHGPSAAEPLAGITRRPPMIPVTNAKIGYVLAGQVRVRECEAVIVNRLLASIDAPEGEAPSILDQLGLRPVDPNAKDLTAELSTRPPSSEE